MDIAENGEAAVERCKTVGYDLVLMDLQMPVMDGLTATRIIRSWESENGRAPTPIVALTAHALKGEIEKSLGAGCNAHITKPIYKDVLLQTIRRHARGHLRAAADAGVPRRRRSGPASCRGFCGTGRRRRRQKTLRYA